MKCAVTLEESVKMCNIVEREYEMCRDIGQQEDA